MKNSEIKEENLEWHLEQPIDIQYEIFMNYVDITKLHYNQLVEKEKLGKTGEKYERGKRYSRW